MTRPKDDWTLGDAKDWLADRRADGEKCPCCHRTVKVYKRPLHSGMAVALHHMWAHRDFDNKFDITTHLTTNKGDTSKLRHWGLIRRHDGDKPGVYEVTPLGARFVRGIVRVPQHADIYLGDFLGLSGDLISIRDALGDKFDYDELMRTPGTMEPGE